MTGCRNFRAPGRRSLWLWPLTALLLLAPNAQAHAPLHIMVDPGHGGTDTGAARGAIKEKEVSLKVSLILAELIKADPRFKVTLTRSTDHKVTLSRRTQMAEDSHVDLFLSIHLNSSPDARARGTEIYFQNQLAADEESMFLVSREHEEGDAGDPLLHADADSSKPEPLSVRTDLKRILEDLHRNHRIQASSELGKTLLETLIRNGTALKSGSRGIRQAPFQVVSLITMPSVLVEIGFLSNAQESQKLMDPEYQNRLARSLFEGLVKFKELMDNEGPETLKN